MKRRKTRYTALKTATRTSVLRSPPRALFSLAARAAMTTGATMIERRRSLPMAAVLTLAFTLTLPGRTRHATDATRRPRRFGRTPGPEHRGRTSGRTDERGMGWARPP